MDTNEIKVQISKDGLVLETTHCSFRLSPRQTNELLDFIQRNPLKSFDQDKGQTSYAVQSYTTKMCDEEFEDDC